MADKIDEESLKTAYALFANNIGIDINDNHELANLIWIAQKAFEELPEGWEFAIGEGDNEGIPYFYNNDTGESVWNHPDEEYYKNLVVKERKRLQEKKNNSNKNKSRDNSRERDRDRENRDYDRDRDRDNRDNRGRENDQDPENRDPDWDSKPKKNTGGGWANAGPSNKTNKKEIEIAEVEEIEDLENDPEFNTEINRSSKGGWNTAKDNSSNPITNNNNNSKVSSNTKGAGGFGMSEEDFLDDPDDHHEFTSSFIPKANSRPNTGNASNTAPISGFKEFTASHRQDDNRGVKFLEEALGTSTGNNNDNNNARARSTSPRLDRDRDRDRGWTSPGNKDRDNNRDRSPYDPRDRDTRDLRDSRDNRERSPLKTGGGGGWTNNNNTSRDADRDRFQDRDRRNNDSPSKSRPLSTSSTTLNPQSFSGNNNNNNNNSELTSYYEKMIEELRKEKDNLYNEIYEIKRQNQHELHMIKQDIYTKDERITELKREKLLLDEKYQALFNQQSIKSYESEEQYNQKLRDIQRNLRLELDQEYQTKQNKLQSIHESEKELLQQEILILKKQNSELKLTNQQKSYQTNYEIDEQILILQHELETYKQQIVQYEQEKQIKLQENKHLKEENYTLNNKLTITMQTMQQFTIENQNIKLTQEQKLQEYAINQQTILQLQQQQYILQEENRQCKLDIQTLRQEKEKNDVELRKLQSLQMVSQDTLTSTETDLRRSKNQHQLEISRLNNRVLELQGINSVLKDEIEKYIQKESEQIRSFQQQINGQELTQQRLQEQCLQLQIKYEESMIRIQSLEKENIQLQDTIYRKEKAIKEHEQQHHHIEKSLAMIRQQYETEENTLKQQIQQIHSDYHRQLQQKDEEIQMIQQEIKEKIPQIVAKQLSKQEERLLQDHEEQFKQLSLKYQTQLQQYEYKQHQIYLEQLEKETKRNYQLQEEKLQYEQLMKKNQQLIYDSHNMELQLLESKKQVKVYETMLTQSSNQMLALPPIPPSATSSSQYPMTPYVSGNNNLISAMIANTTAPRHPSASTMPSTATTNNNNVYYNQNVENEPINVLNSSYFLQSAAANQSMMLTSQPSDVMKPSSQNLQTPAASQPTSLEQMINNDALQYINAQLSSMKDMLNQSLLPSNASSSVPPVTSSKPPLAPPAHNNIASNAQQHKNVSFQLHAAEGNDDGSIDDESETNKSSSSYLFQSPDRVLPSKKHSRSSSQRDKSRDLDLDTSVYLAMSSHGINNNREHSQAIHSLLNDSNSLNQSMSLLSEINSSYLPPTSSSSNFATNPAMNVEKIDDLPSFDSIRNGGFYEGYWKAKYNKMR